MKYVFFIYCLIFISPLILLSQNIDERGVTMPAPLMGWDSMYVKIPHLGVIKHNEMEGRILVVLYINNKGQVEDISVGDFIDDEEFDSSASERIRDIVREYFSTVKWKPAVKNGSNIDYKIRVPIYFMSNKFGEVDSITVHSSVSIAFPSGFPSSLGKAQNAISVTKYLEILRKCPRPVYSFHRTSDSVIIDYKDIPMLIDLLDSKDSCANVMTSISSFIDFRRSTIGQESAYLIQGFRVNRYPPGLNSTQFRWSKEEILNWWKAYKASRNRFERMRSVIIPGK